MSNEKREIRRLSAELNRSEVHIETLNADKLRLQQRLETLLLRLDSLQGNADSGNANPVHWLEQAKPGSIERARRLARKLTWALTGKLRMEQRKQAEAAAVLHSGLFDRDYYIKTNPDVIIAGQRPLAHWLANGWREGRNPHPLFDTAWYLEQHPGLTDSGPNPLQHWMADKHGQTSILFDPQWYLEQYPEARTSALAPLIHYLQQGAARGYCPSPLFDHQWYLAQSADIADSGINPLIHYIVFGAAAGRDPCPLFGGNWYLQRYPDVAATGMNPLEHFLKYGAAKNYDPGPLFDTQWYRRQHPEIDRDGVNPLAHYLSTGTRDGLLPNPAAELPLTLEHDAAAATLDNSYSLSRMLPPWDGQWASLPAAASTTPRQILVVDEKHPTPDLDSGSFRMRKILDCLIDMGREVVFVGDQAPIADHYVSDIEALGITCFTGRQAGLRHLMSRGSDIGTVLLSRPGVCERYLPLVRAFAPNATVLYDTVDLHWVRLQRAARVSNEPAPLLQSADHYHRVEMVNARASDITIAITEDEREILLAQDPNLQVSVIPNIHDVSEPIAPFEQRHGLFFIGSFVHLPNIEAVHYLVDKILPRVVKHIPDIRLHIVGSQMPDEIATLASVHVDPLGYVDDVSPWFNQSRLFVAPLLHGAGMKGKIGQALSFGLPVVTTTIGAEGIGLDDGDSALISDDPEDFAQRIVAAYRDEKLWQRLSSNGQRVIARQFSPATVSDRIAELVQAGNPHKPPLTIKQS